ncbi:MAG: YfhO family protein, partial [Clostridia bacterium]|nr:YfhO family protein [Clostridia bacterium]
HGGQEPNWLNYRYSFMFSFLLLVIGYRGFEQLRRVSTQFLAVVPAVLGIFLVILQQEGYGENYEYTGAVFPKAYSYDLLFYFLSPIVIGAVFLAILYFKKKGGNRLGTLALTCTILGETLFIGLLSQIALACDVSYSFRADYADFINRVEPAVEYIQDLDDGFYRMDKTFHRQPADAMALELRGVSSTTSTLNRHTLKLLDQLGFVAGSYWSQYTGGNPVTDMILGMKYIITEDTSPDALYQRVYTDEQGEAVYGYLNPYALSIGYTVNDAVLDLNFNDYDSPMVLLNDLVAAMTGKDELRPFVKLSAEDSYEDITLARSSSAKHLIYKTSEGGTAPLLTFTFTAESTDPVYLYFSTDYPRDCTLYIDGKESGTAMANDSDGIIYVGRFEEGSSHTVSLAPLEEKIYLRENQTIFWHLDEEILKESYSALQKGQYEISADYTEEHLKGTVKVDGKDTLLFTSIPYDEGWRITVDGNEVKPLTFTTPVYDEVTGEQLGVEEQPYQDALIVLRLTPGTHQIEFRYMPDCFLYGGAVSLISLFVLALITAIDYLLIRRYKKRRMAAVPVSGELSASDNLTEQSIDTPAEAVQEPSEAADQQTAPQDVSESEKPKKEHRKKKRK